MPRKKVEAPHLELLNREQTAEALGCSDWEVRRLQKTGELSAIQIDRTYFFHRRDVQQHMRRSVEGSRHAKCFSRFSEGMTPERVVIDLQMPFEEVEHIYQGWLRMADAVVFRPSDGVSRKQWELAYGVKVTPQNVLKALSIVATHADLCSQLEPLSDKKVRP